MSLCLAACHQCLGRRLSAASTASLHPLPPRTTVGGVLVTLNPALRAEELAHALRTSGVSTLVLAPEARGVSLLDLLGKVVASGSAPKLRRSIVLGHDVPEGELQCGQQRVCAMRSR